MANLVLRKITTPDGTVMFNCEKSKFKTHRDSILNTSVFMLGNEFQNQNDFPNLSGFTITEIFDTDASNIVKANFYVGNFADFVTIKYKETPLKDLPKADLIDLVENKASIFNIETWALQMIMQEIASRS